MECLKDMAKTSKDKEGETGSTAGSSNEGKTGPTAGSSKSETAKAEGYQLGYDAWSKSAFRVKTGT